MAVDFVRGQHILHHPSRRWRIRSVITSDSHAR